MKKAKSSTKSKSKKQHAEQGDKLSCEECGMTVIVEDCGDNEDVCGVSCCGEPMQVCSDEEEQVE